MKKLKRIDIERFLELGDQNAPECNPDLYFVDEDPPLGLTELQWAILTKFADQVIPACDLEIYCEEDYGGSGSYISSKGAGSLGFRAFCHYAEKEFYARKIAYSSSTRRHNDFRRKLEKTASLLENLAIRDYSDHFQFLSDQEATTCVANFELIYPELFDYMRTRVMESYFSHETHKGNPKNHSWKRLCLSGMFQGRVGNKDE